MVHLLHNLQVRPYFKYIHTRLIKSVILLTHSCLWLDDFPVSCHAMRSRTCSYGTPLWIIWLWEFWILKGFDVTLSTCIRDFSLAGITHAWKGLSSGHSCTRTWQTPWWTWDPTLPSGHSCTRTWQPLIDELEILHDVRTHITSLVLDANITL